MLDEDIITVHVQFFKAFTRQSSKPEVQIPTVVNSFKTKYGQFFEGFLVFWSQNDLARISRQTKQIIHTNNEILDLLACVFSVRGLFFLNCVIQAVCNV